jgi:carboxylate-amine ligase
VEIRVCDTPLTVERAASLSAYAQALAIWLLKERPREPQPDLYRVYSFNRFSACRFGVEGGLVDPYSRTRRSIRDDILATLEQIKPHWRTLECQPAIDDIAAVARSGRNDAAWMRALTAKTGSLANAMRQSAELWAKGNPTAN